MHHHQFQAARQYQWTVENFRKLTPKIRAEDSPVELIEGDLLERAPIGNRHTGKLERLRRLIEQAAGNSALVFSRNLVILGAHSSAQIAKVKSLTHFLKEKIRD